ncbi:hypothetical protein K788_0007547 [Paraburkholderia caribensis MBA4]|uniref:Uncharacterized protein n=1 Tax=Paraburkholderia caribensis MBA4 TaxID=1323664 RepID=A0A0N7JVI0_9BURK|nr:hypothetical protein K788_0007547 [Paraburkholderia caribensis MBA4]
MSRDSIFSGPPARRNPSQKSRRHEPSRPRQSPTRSVTRYKNQAKSKALPINFMRFAYISPLK